MTLIKFTYQFKISSFNKGQVVYTEGQISDYVYLVKEGEFKLTKKRVTEKTEKICVH
jgi:CRP-like cAMP-binding protein